MIIIITYNLVQSDFEVEVGVVHETVCLLVLMMIIP